jgi:hypothetical protein
MIIIMIMSMEWDYVSKPQPPTELFFISQVIFEYGEHGGMLSTGKNS